MSVRLAAALNTPRYLLKKLWQKYLKSGVVKKTFNTYSSKSTRGLCVAADRKQRVLRDIGMLRGPSSEDRVKSPRPPIEI